MRACCTIDLRSNSGLHPADLASANGRREPPVVRHVSRGLRTMSRMRIPAWPAVVAMCIATTVFAAGRERAVRPLPEGFYVATVIDATTSRAVIEAEVTTGTRTTKTDARGAFSILVPAGRPTSLTIKRSGYDDAS